MVSERRKGAARIADVAPDILAGLTAGKIEAATLSENLATDFAALLAATIPELATQAKQIDAKAGITKRMAQVAHLLSEDSGQERLAWLSQHPSDLLRGWGAYLLALDETLTLSEKLQAMRPFADDSHFGVREWAWLALRTEIATKPLEAIDTLIPFTLEESEYLRRFACEAIRPRGVWAAHIKLLKDTPEHCLPILNPLRADQSRYVQDSVANWLNDAWKSQPDWVETLCARWAEESPTDATTYIVKRALRNKK